MSINACDCAIMPKMQMGYCTPTVVVRIPKKRLHLIGGSPCSAKQISAWLLQFMKDIGQEGPKEHSMGPALPLLWSVPSHHHIQKRRDRSATTARSVLEKRLWVLLERGIKVLLLIPLSLGTNTHLHPCSLEGLHCKGRLFWV